MDNESGADAPTDRTPPARAPGDTGADDATTSDDGAADDDAASDANGDGTPRKRRRGSRGGQRRRRPDGPPAGDADDAPELPEPLRENRPSAEAAERALVRKPQIGDTRPAPASSSEAAREEPQAPSARRGRGRTGTSGGRSASGGGSGGGGRGDDGKRKRGARAPKAAAARTPLADFDDLADQRRGRERNGRPVGRYLMCVQVRPDMAQVAVLEGRSLIEHYVSRPADDISQIHGNIYVGRVQNVLPGMEAAFVDIGTPKNAVLYRGDVQYDAEDVEEKGGSRIEQLLRAGQTVLCQVTKNPIGTKGARLTQEVSMAGRFVVLIPNSSTYGISKRLSDEERKRLRRILDEVRPQGQGLIVRTAAEGATPEELRRDVERL